MPFGACALCKKGAGSQLSAEDDLAFRCEREDPKLLCDGVACNCRCSIAVYAWFGFPLLPNSAFA